ncbi:DUF4127 family protein [Thermoanaerobacterium thermosaccharolyticum]|uniref:DUF4127 family protein n=1 Tax=Thermoanaerobacterium thermosaccharolyticum M0795 TaxID=698948 RepID=L0IN16_THETR|nr:DUF4127 family protein [Thermoanaerobacterium thermosaccharolyticum]AGB19342.1 hypothetical protein Thethe_01713 [Thermoanaerobacterium thermosaccharolyticum M0795]
MNIAYIPLDDRPCNYDWLIKACKIKKMNIVTPKKEDLGNFVRPGSVQNINNWLREIENIDYLILSIDMLVYGGLIASRNFDIISLNKDELFSSIKIFKRNNPKAKIYGFSILMRTSISVTNKISQKYYEYINEYSRLIYNEEINTNRINELTKLIPHDLLTSYLNVRKRNHIINMESIELVKEGLLDFLVIGQEDCYKEGIHIIEQNELRNLIDKNFLHDKILLMPGADELGQIMFVRILNDINKMKIGQIIYDSDINKNIIAQYENMSIKETMDLHVKACNFDTDEKNNEYILYIITPRYTDDVLIDKKILLKNAVDTEMKFDYLKKYINNNKVIIFDLCHANGGFVDLIKYLIENNLLTKLYGYTAWNTASNSIGTGLLFYSLIYEIGKYDFNYKLLLSEFLLERLLDDFVYQRIVRQKVEKLLEDIKVNIYHFHEDYNNKLVELMKENSINIINLFKCNIINIIGVKSKKIKFICNFPWNRTFEININVEIQT